MKTLHLSADYFFHTENAFLPGVEDESVAQFHQEFLQMGHEGHNWGLQILFIIFVFAYPSGITICDAFGFDTPEGCRPTCTSRKSTKGRIGRPPQATGRDLLVQKIAILSQINQVVMKIKVALLTVVSLLCASCGPKVALSTFKDLPNEISVETIGNRVAEQLLASDPLDYGNNLPGYQAPYNYGRGGKEMNYSVVSLWVNSIEFAHRSHNKKLEKRLIDFFEPFYGERKDKCNRDNHVDFSIFGAIPLEIYLMNGDKRALELGLRYADHQWEDPTGEPGKKVGGNGNFPIEEQREFLANGYSPQTRLWIDDMYMITVLQTQAYRATGDRKYIDRAAREMKMYMDSLQRDNGLFYHAPDVPFFWGRGNGWMAAGLPMLLTYLPEDSEYRPSLKEAYLKMMPTLLEYQRENGMWGQVIDDPEFWDESSCSAMFAYAFIEGIRSGLLDEATYGPAARKAWVSLCGKLDEHANLADICIGTDRRNSREWYMDRPRSNGDPHGQMAMMWICSALLQ